jgi:hypothetical protein
MRSPRRSAVMFRHYGPGRGDSQRGGRARVLLYPNAGTSPGGPLSTSSMRLLLRTEYTGGYSLGRSSLPPFVGDPAYSKGNLGTALRTGAAETIQILPPTRARVRAVDCARLFCSLRCAANAYHATGSSPHIRIRLQLFRKRMECAIMLKAAEEAEHQA